MRDKGVPIDNVSNYDTTKEQIIAVLPQSSLNIYRLLFVTKSAMMKIVSGGEFDVTRKLVAATKLSDGDELLSVSVVTDEESCVLYTENGYALRFMLEELPDQKKTAVGVHGMNLAKNDTVADMWLLKPDEAKEVSIGEKSFDIGTIKIAGRNTKGYKLKLK